jgi:hypothetical protein
MPAKPSDGPGSLASPAHPARPWRSPAACGAGRRPGVGLAAGAQPQRRALRRRAGPSARRRLQPVQQRGQLVGAQAQAPATAGTSSQARSSLKRQSAAAAPAAAIQRQQQRVAAALALVGQAPGDVARMAARNWPNTARMAGAKVSMSGTITTMSRGLSAGLRRPGCGQQVQQLVVQHLHLALRAVADVEDDGAVARQRRCGQAPCSASGSQVADVGLQLLQQRAAGARRRTGRCAAARKRCACAARRRRHRAGARSRAPAGPRRPAAGGRAACISCGGTAGQFGPPRSGWRRRAAAAVRGLR